MSFFDFIKAQPVVTKKIVKSVRIALRETDGKLLFKPIMVIVLSAELLLPAFIELGIPIENFIVVTHLAGPYMTDGLQACGFVQRTSGN
jgi:hypothetical protein